MKFNGKVFRQVIKEQRRLSYTGLFTSMVNFCLFYIYGIGDMVKHELKSSVNLPLRHTLRAWRHGLKRFSYRMYGLVDSGDPAEYLSDYEFIKTERINGKFVPVIKNKLLFSLLMKRCGMPTPETFGVIHKGLFHPLDSERIMGPSKFLNAFLKTDEPLVLKPIRSGHGVGFMVVQRKARGCHLNGEYTPLSFLTGLIGKLDQYVVTQFVTQREYSARLYPDTINTIRVLTFWDTAAAKPFIGRAVHRIGASRSHPVDNFKAGGGGLSALIDQDTGELGPGAMVSAGGRVSWHTHHPESQAQIQSVVVPSWAEIKVRILECADRFAFTPYIAWDFVPTESGLSILEGNNKSGMAALQVHGPMLADPRIRRFYKYHRVIK